jgi:PKD repeat protein
MLLGGKTVAAGNTRPVAAFSSSCTDLACTFADQSTDAEGPITTWGWTFGDGAASTQQNPVHGYAAGGTYTVALTVTDAAGAQHTIEHSVSVTAPNAPPVAAFGASCTGLTCAFADQSTDADGPITSWNWSFGDGTTSVLQSPTHSYSAAGSYPVTLTVTDGAGVQAAVQHVVTASSGITTWSALPPLTSEDLEGVWGSAAGTVYAVGRRGTVAPSW